MQFLEHEVCSLGLPSYQKESGVRGMIKFEVGRGINH